jgi:hypothetical protein
MSDERNGTACSHDCLPAADAGKAARAAVPAVEAEP